MRFGASILFEDATCTFLAGRRYAITGPNGAGKSTLMTILSGELEPSIWTVTHPKKFGVLRQDQFASDRFRVIDAFIMGNAPLRQALEEREAVYDKPHGQLTDEDGIRLGELEGSLCSGESVLSEINCPARESPWSQSETRVGPDYAR